MSCYLLSFMQVQFFSLSFVSRKPTVVRRAGFWQPWQRWMAELEYGASLPRKLEHGTAQKESLLSCLTPNNLVNVLLRCQSPVRSSRCHFKKG